MDFGLGRRQAQHPSSRTRKSEIGIWIADLNARSGRSGTLRATAARLDAALRQRAGRSGHLQPWPEDGGWVAGTAETYRADWASSVQLRCHHE